MIFNPYDYITNSNEEFCEIKAVNLSMVGCEAQYLGESISVNENLTIVASTNSSNGISAQYCVKIMNREQTMIIDHLSYR